MDSVNLFSGLSREEFIKLLGLKIQFGRHAGKKLLFLPYEYLVWMKKNGISIAGLEKNEWEKYIDFLYQAHTDGSIDILRDNFGKFFHNSKFC